MYTPFFATCMVIQIPPSGQIFVGRIGNTGNFCLWDPEYMKFLFVGSAIMKVLFVGSGIQQIFVCGIRNHESFVCGIRNTPNFCLWDPDSCALESPIQLKESGTPLTTGIQNSSSLTKNLESITWNPESTLRNPESKTWTCSWSTIFLR